MEKKRSRIIEITAIFITVFISMFIATQACFAGNIDKHVITNGVSTAGTLTTDELVSANEGSIGDNIRVSCSGSTVHIEGDTCLTPIGSTDFRVRVVEQIGWGNVKKEISLHSSYGAGRYYFSGDMNMSDMSDGEYTIFIYRGSDKRRFYRNCVLKVTDGQVAIKRYNNILNSNRKAHEIMSQYDKCNSFLDPRLTDVYLMLRRTAGAKGSKLTADEMEYIKNVADRVTRYASNDYQKAFAIMEYIDDNFYYDRSNPSNGRAVTNPAVLIQRNERGQEAATNCVGYAALFASLARAEGIPTRIIYGVHRMDSCWALNVSLKKENHHWTEFYYNGRWIMADADVGAGKYRELDGEYSVTDTTLSYTFFDATEEQIAQNYIILGVYKKPTLETPKLNITHTSSGNNRISWNSVNDATRYTIYRSMSKYGEYEEFKTITSRHLIDLNALTGNKYFYRVVAVPTNVNREASAMSNIVSGTDRLKTPVISIKGTKTDIRLTWDRIKDASGYKIYRSRYSDRSYKLIKRINNDSIGDDDEINEDDESTIRFIDDTAKKKTVYYYKVVAVHENSDANSMKSDYVSAKRKTAKKK